MASVVCNVKGNVVFQNCMHTCIRNSNNNNVKGSNIQGSLNNEESVQMGSTLEKHPLDTAHAQPNNAYPPAIPYNTRPPTSELRNSSETVTSPDFRHSEQKQWLDCGLSDEPMSSPPPSPCSPVEYLNSASWDQDTSRRDCGAGRYVDQAGHHGLPGEGGFMWRTATECERVTQPPGFPVPAIPSSPPICTCVPYESNVPSVAFSMPVPTHMGLHTTLCPPSPGAKVTTLRYEEWPGPPRANSHPTRPSPQTPAIPLLDTTSRTQTTFRDYRHSPLPYGGLDGSTTFPDTPPCPTPGFPVPWLHASYHQS